ncbi:MAG: FxsA family protein, partial [Proteobacteria bacterium]
MFLTFVIFSFAMMYAEFQTASKVYGLIADRTDPFSAIALVALTFVAIASFGAWLIKYQSRSLVHKFKNVSQTGTMPKPNILMFIAGVLFIIPGYVTDILALLLIFPPTAWLVKK